MERKLHTATTKNEEISNQLKSETKNKEQKLAKLEEKIASLTDLCAQLEKEKHIEVQKTTNQKQLIDQVNFLTLLYQLIFFLINRNIFPVGKFL